MREVGRGAIIGGIAAALVVGAAVALGAGTDVRIHRLHVPPPPVGSGDISQPGAPGSPNPPDPAAPPAPPGTPSPPGSPPPPPGAPPPPPPGVVCTMNTGETTGLAGTGQLT